MILQRQLAISAFELDIRDCAVDAQHFVVISFCVGGQSKPFSKLWAHLCLGVAFRTC
jgi:hypothetical protein